MSLVIYNQEIQMVIKNQNQTDGKGDQFVKRKN